MKHKSESRREMREMVTARLDNSETISAIRTAAPSDTAVAALAAEIQRLNPQVKDVDSLIEYGLNITDSGSALHSALRTLLGKVREAKKASTACHREKRALAAALGVKRKAQSISELIQATAGDGDGTEVRVVWRNRNTALPIKLRSVLADTKCRSQDDVIADEANGFYIAGSSESVIFLSKSGDHDSDVTIELIVLRGIAQGAQESGDLYRWASEVIAQACSERRNVRPQHDGAIVQLGWNAGPRNARVWGLAKSWNRKADLDTMVMHDEDAVALLTICWSLARAHFPPDAIDYIEKCFNDSGLPHLATRNVAEGMGYRLEINGKTFQFPNVTRAPPEGYFSQDYVAWAHVDRCFARYAVAWCVDRIIDNPEEAEAHPVKKENTSLWPADGGGNFVDITLGVNVRQAKATLILFQPEFAHGTTRLCGAHNRLCTVTFSSHILDAFKAAAKETKVVPGAGGGEGDTD